MTADELIVVHQAARAELESAFEGIPITISDRRDAFWRVVVEPAQPARRNARLPAAGETWAMGRFGAYSHVDFDVLAHAAVTYAPEGASRATVLAGLARGIGRTAAHELAHAALGPSPVMDLTDDEWSYEFHSHARAAHYYGALHWAMARPALLSRLGS